MTARLKILIMLILVAVYAGMVMAGESSKTLTIVGLGDSTTAGTPGYFSPREAPPSGRGNPESQYAYWIEKKHPDWSVLNRGVRGQRTDQILERFEYDVLNQHPDAVIILAGVNDIHQGYPTAHVLQNLEKLYTLSQTNGIKVIACTILPYNLADGEAAWRIEEVNAWIAKYAKEHGLIFCDTNKAVSDPKNPGKLAASPDDIHPDVEGYRKMAEAIESVIETNLSHLGSARS